jgi:hypothetical protein
MRWSRKSDESLFLEIMEGDKWVNYKNCQFYVPDVKMSSNSGFATAQKYLSLGFKYLTTMTYIELLTKLLNSELSINGFQELFLTKFKNDKSLVTHDEFQVLDNFFADVDSFCPSNSDLFDPDLDLNEKELLESAKQTLEKLEELK